MLCLIFVLRLRYVQFADDAAPSRWHPNRCRGRRALFLAASSPAASAASPLLLPLFASTLAS